jgi:hypothetical protein
MMLLKMRFIGIDVEQTELTAVQIMQERWRVAVLDKTFNSR